MKVESYGPHVEPYAVLLRSRMGENNVLADHAPSSGVEQLGLAVQ